MHFPNLTPSLIAAGMIATLTGTATAAPLAPPDLYPPTISQAVNLLGTQQTSQLPNSLFKEFTGPKGSTSGQTSVALGSAPALFSGMSEASGAGPGLHGGSTFAMLTYQFEYVVPQGGYSDIDVYINAVDNLHASATGVSAFATAESFLSVSGSGHGYYLNHCVAAITEAGAPCGNKSATPINPFSLALKTNTPYWVQLQVASQAIANYDRMGPSAAASTAALDIRGISLRSPGYPNGTFYFSQGIAPVPEPASWALLTSGLGLLAFMARRRKTVHC